MEDANKDHVSESPEATAIDGVVYWMLWLVARAEELDYDIHELPR